MAQRYFDIVSIYCIQLDKTMKTSIKIEFHIKTWALYVSVEGFFPFVINMAKRNTFSPQHYTHPYTYATQGPIK